MGNTQWTRDRVIAEIRDRLLKGLSLSIRDVHRDSPALFSVARRHFGSWANALKESGVSYGDFSSWEKAVKEAGAASSTVPKDKDAVLAAIQARAASGLSLDLKALKKSSPTLYEAALKEFGSWYAAVRTAGYRLP